MVAHVPKCKATPKCDLNNQTNAGQIFSLDVNEPDMPVYNAVAQMPPNIKQPHIPKSMDMGAELYTILFEYIIISTVASWTGTGLIWLDVLHKQI